ncbi:MAG: hypothetical protein HKN93_06780 [Acidimicrobiia bacterium]|nr:hypothetical protein [Acidimicrobiia bacterium]
MRRLIAVMATALLVLSLAGSASATPRDDAGEHKVTVCHATNSKRNPWVLVTVDLAATNGRGHEIHKDGADLFPATSLDDCGAVGDQDG